MSERLERALAAIDRLHAEDPSHVDVDGAPVPRELAYARRMTEALETLVTSPSEALRIAVRAQHLCRWRHPRDAYPEGRKGYLRWRREAGQAHAALAREVLAEAGYEPPAIDAVTALIEKRRRDEEGQALEDAACLTFLRYELADFARGRDREQVLDILRKTWRKMSEAAHAQALTIADARPWLEAAAP